MLQKLPQQLIGLVLCSFFIFVANSSKSQSTFTTGNLVVLQTTGSVSKASSAITIKEFTTTGTAGITVPLPASGTTPIQTSGVFGGSEGFLTLSTDNKYLLLGGYGTAASYTDITATASSAVPRVVGTIAPSGFYLQTGSSSTFYTSNDIRGAISDGTNYWASGASNDNIDGIDYYGPGTPTAIGVAASNPPKAYGLHIFNGQIYYSTQKAGPINTSSQLGIFALGNGLPTSNPVTITQVINTAKLTPQDFSFNPAANFCYIAINGASGGIQKWTKSGSTWTLAYTLVTGAANTGAYGLAVDYSGANPVIYATTFESTNGNRIIKIVDAGASSTATTIVAAQANVYYKGISFAPVASGTPVVNLTVSTNTASEAAQTVVTVTANASAAVTGDQTVNLAVSGNGIASGDYTLSNTMITIPDGAVNGSVTFTVNDDAVYEGQETATLNIANPSAGINLGTRTSQNITIDDNDVANNPPTIVFNVNATSNFIDGDSTTAPASPFTASGVINDPTDPVSTSGIAFAINDIETDAGSLTVTAASSNTAVAPVANIAISGTGAVRVVKITPAGVGYSTITVTVSDGANNTSYVINYAASAASNTPAATLWHTGISDASDAIVLDDNYYVTGDDELDVLNVYSRSNSGLPLASYNYSAYLSLPDITKPEVDVEASARSFLIPSLVYWLGSMSNGKDPFPNKPNRDRLFATTITGTGSSTSFAIVGYGAIRSSLIAWGDTHGYDFSSSAAAGVDSKSPDGFAAEGMVFGPDSTTLYIGLRAPLVPTANRTKAVIAPILNFETWFNNGSPSGDPTYGNPIELDLGQRGIRDLIRLSNGTYVIVAGSSGADYNPALYKWTGSPLDMPILVSSSFADNLNMEGVMQVNNNGTLSLSQLQIISDGGDNILYNDGKEAKGFNQLILRKFRPDNVSGLDLCMPTKGDTTATVCSSFSWYGTVYTQSGTSTHIFTNAAGCDSTVTLHLTVNQPTTGDTTAVVCDSLVWYGVKYTESDTPIHIFTNATGCDSVVTLHLTVNHSTYSSQPVAACGSYTWNGINYTQSGTYTYSTTNAAGCDSTATLVLTINHATMSLTTDTVCSNSLPYIWNGVDYTQSGTYTYTTTNAAGCDSVATLLLTVHQSPVVSVSHGAISCNGGTTYIAITATSGTTPYTYKVNNKKYKTNTVNNIQAGRYTITVTDATGCSTSVKDTITQPAKLKVSIAGTTRPTCKGGNNGVIKVNATGGATPYTYSINGGPFLSTSTFTGLFAGSYTIIVRDANGCTSSTTATLADGTKNCPGGSATKMNSTAKSSTDTFKITVLPNPSISSFQLIVSSREDKEIHIVVTDVYGRTVYTASGLPSAKYTFGNNFASGVYIVKAVQGSQVQTVKIIKSE